MPPTRAARWMTRSGSASENSAATAAGSRRSNSADEGVMISLAPRPARAARTARPRKPLPPVTRMRASSHVSFGAMRRSLPTRHGTLGAHVAGGPHRGAELAPRPRGHGVVGARAAPRPARRAGPRRRGGGRSPPPSAPRPLGAAGGGAPDGVATPPPLRVVAPPVRPVPQGGARPRPDRRRPRVGRRLPGHGCTGGGDGARPRVPRRRGARDEARPSVLPARRRARPGGGRDGRLPLGGDTPSVPRRRLRAGAPPRRALG